MSDLPRWMQPPAQPVAASDTATAAPASPAPAPGGKAAPGALPPLKVSGAPRMEGIASADTIAQARADADAEAHAQLGEMTAPPESPAGYKLPQDVRGLTGEEITASREAAFAIGLSPGEFRTVALVLDHCDPKSVPTDHRILVKHADAMGQDLERRHGVEGAEAIARRAVAAVDGACKSLPQLRPVLRYLLTTNRPFLEMLARVGERMEKR